MANRTKTMGLDGSGKKVVAHLIKGLIILDFGLQVLDFFTFKSEI